MLSGRPGFAAVAILAIGLIGAVLMPAGLTAQDPRLGRTIQVPIEYSDKSLGTASLHLEFGAPFNPPKPIVLIVSDGQLYYVRPGSVGELQNALFGDKVNVIGAITRGRSVQHIRAISRHFDRIRPARLAAAWQVFKSRQWVGDVESVRRGSVGRSGKIMLYGRPGGAYLVHERLATHGEHVSRAFTQSAVHPLVNRELGIELDTFWSDLGRQGADLQGILKDAVRRHPKRRLEILLALQRQHFYEPPAELMAARTRLIRAAHAGQLDVLTALSERRQHSATLGHKRVHPTTRTGCRTSSSSRCVRRSRGEEIRPLIDVQRVFTQPLLDLINSGAIAAPTFDLSAAHRLTTTEVFVLEGYGDEAVNYRTSIALAFRYPRHHLFIANDNHLFSRLEQSADLRLLVSTFLGAGLQSTVFREALVRAARHQWRGRTAGRD